MFILPALLRYLLSLVTMSSVIQWIVAAVAVYQAGQASAAPTRRASTPISSITSTQWAALNQSVGGRLYAGYPMAKSCYRSVTRHNRDNSG